MPLELRPKDRKILSLMLLEVLEKQVSSDPRIMQQIEEEINRLVSLPSMDELLGLLQSPRPAMNVYLCKVLELRVRRAVGTRSLWPEIEFATQLLTVKPTYQACKLYSLLGLYCWPVEMPGFMNEIAIRLDHAVGYQILLQFLEMVNFGTEIDEKRRAELKKAIGFVMKELMGKFTDEFAEYIIPIFTQLTKIVQLSYDWSIVERQAAQNQSAVIDFLTEAGNAIEPDRIVNLIEQLDPDVGMLQTLSTLNVRRISSPDKVYAYVFRCLVEDEECFVPSVEFWQRIFSAKTNGGILEPVLKAVIGAYSKIGDEACRDEADTALFGFLSIVAKNYPSHAVQFLQSGAELPPHRITSNFLQKIAKSAELSHGNVFAGVSFESPYLNALVHYLRSDSSTPTLITTLDFFDKESIKLVLLIIKKFEFTTQQIAAIMSMCDNGSLATAELRVECMARLGLHSTFDGEWTMPKVIEFYYCMKRDPITYAKYKEGFYALFLQSAPFDRCFSIVKMSGEIPTVILSSIYEKMDKYPYIELNCFNTDLLCFLESEAQRPFLEREVARFVNEWTTIREHKEYYMALKSLLNIFALRADVPGFIDLMIDLVSVDYSLTLNRIVSIFNNYKGEYNTHKAFIYFMRAYNASNLEESQAQLAGALTTCLYRPDGPAAFSENLQIDINKCCSVRDQILKCNKKSAQNIVRNLIKDFKGVALRKLYADGPKVTKQDFLKNMGPKANAPSDDQILEIN